jgi:hypothetical protein
MYCSECGRELAGDAKFCSFCGKKVDNTGDEKNENVDEENLTNKSTNLSDETIAQRLKPYSELMQCYCRECGYNGKMGVVKKEGRIAYWLVFIVIVLVLSAVLWLVDVYLYVNSWGDFDYQSTFSRVKREFIAVGITCIFDKKLKKAFTKTTLYCPHCQRILYQNQ